jgi:chromosome segregation protein
MRLTKLELHGFKSFADSTTLVFEPGVTAIVGPNGCGKSNVSDAVRWVLGEQRARALRGVKMDEVIFQGSSARRPVSVAEVSLHFDNDDGLLPVAYREVVVTRRLSRSGESDYLLNRSPCRLRDIHDLLRGTGLGADAGVVIESRMVDALLSDRPDDRRELFEEAAGVGLYRDRRRTTERRLEETAVDLARLDDLLGEVQTQVRSLARQRRRAERHAEITARRFVVELTLATRELAAAREELTAIDAAVATLRARGPAAETAAAAAEQRRERAHRDRASAEARRTDLARLVAAQHQQIATQQGEIGVAEERHRNALARRQRAEDERRDGEARGSRVLAEHDAAADERRAAEAGVAEATGMLDACATREESAREALATARLAADEHERDIRELRDAAAHLEIERAGAEREHAEVVQRLTTLAAERTALADRVAAAGQGAAAAAAESLVAQRDAGRAAADHAEAQAAAVQARDAEAASHQSSARAEASLAEVDGTVQALDRLERDRVGLAPAAARLLAERALFDAGAILGPLSDFLTASTADAAVVERFLGATLHAVVVRDHAAADAVRRWHASVEPGPLCLLPLSDGLAAALAPEPGGEASLADRVSPAPAARPWVQTLLGRVRELDAGTAFEDAYGAIWLPGTLAGKGPLQRRAELVALREAREAAAAAREAAAASAAAAQSALTETQTRAAAAAEAAADADQRARRAQEERAARAREVERAEREFRQAEERRGQLSERATALATRMAALVEHRAEVDDRRAERERVVAAARVALERAEREQEDARESRTAAQVRLAQAQARGQVATDRARRLAEEYATAVGRVDALRTELVGLSTADVELVDQMAAWRADLAARQAALRDAETRLDAAESAVVAADADLLAAEQALDTARHEQAGLSDELHRVQLRHAEIAGHEHAVREKLEGEWRRPWDALLAELVPLDTESEALQSEAAELRDQMAGLGPVNALAIEEHDEELKRFEFLSAQRTDLAAGKASLQQAIREIDATAQELFLATFADVRENFRQIFMTLFGGGECDLRLANPDAPLECDIEIHASPRGKRTQRIHLLSSGERALVALSLLFGIFLTKPSPFCLLDEVDAPLDDQNIGRFVRMLNEFKVKTQFIVITHNPRTTTEAADAVYGVTMQEPGVSSVVSVRLRPAVVGGGGLADDVAPVTAEPALQEA